VVWPIGIFESAVDESSPHPIICGLNDRLPKAGSGKGVEVQHEESRQLIGNPSNSGQSDKYRLPAHKKLTMIQVYDHITFVLLDRLADHPVADNR
jgi:hypothetical protein